MNDSYTLLYLKWIADKDFCRAHGMCSLVRGSLDGGTLGENGRCCVAAWMGELWERTDTRICMADPLHCSPETLTTLLIGCEK